MKRLFSLILIIGPFILHSQESQVRYLSGTGFDRTATWEFYCTAGRNSGQWTTIQVPSCWEQQGFGEYHYGHVPFEERLKEEGHYRHLFNVPDDWEGMSVDVVFEGVMTDCRVVLNGRQAGEVHQGAFYRFSYEISELLHYGKENTLEVFVKKFSGNMSVNQAERKADYWIFGGIFRPVYLVARPKEHIRRVAIDARADGSFRADVYTSNLRKGSSLRVEVLEADGQEKSSFTAETGDGRVHRLEGVVEGIQPWNPEFPALYQAEFVLLDRKGEVLHRHREKTGFRTVEVRAQDGIYVNGRRIKFKGVNRHSFHPDHGRTSSREFSIQVVNLIKDMNMNAVRMSHYPPDKHFLEVCDSLGLFVLDELAGWQRPPYDSVVGRKLLGEMIARDVNHPSVVMWDNGNEGGWNTAYDSDFREMDIQQREVNHPWAVHGSTNTAHYMNYDHLSMDHFAPRKVFFPTELIHGLYDGGHGAGLEDYWLRIWEHPLAAGCFLWVFADEAIRRTDTGELDTDGNHAPDGILGPYHQKEGSYYTIRHIWSPVHLEERYITPEFNGIFRVQNRFHYTGLDQCTFRYHWLDLPGPGNRGSRYPDEIESARILDFGSPLVDPLSPGQWGELAVPLTEGWRHADVLTLEAVDPHGRLIHLWSWPVKSPASISTEELESEFPETMEANMQPVKVRENASGLELEAGGVVLEISRRDGRLVKVESNGSVIPLTNGPLFRRDDPELKSFRHFAREDAHVAVADYGASGSLTWTIHRNGLVDMELSYQPEGGTIPYTGASFTYPEEGITSVSYMGNGPYRVWKNRMKGVQFHVWEKPFNETITGHSGYEYPEFKGYYSELYWARFYREEGVDFTVYSHTRDLFLRLFTPGEAPQPARTTVSHPKGDLSFMRGIPAIGTKFKEPRHLGPLSRPYQYLPRRVEGEALSVSLTFDFRTRHR